jgi:hypothetical protein
MTAIAHVNNPIALTSDLDRLLALVDFEWVRLGPVDLELEAFIRFGEELGPAGARLYADVPAWLRRAYPALFAHPQLDQRLRLYELALCLRQLLVWPPRAPLPALPPGHPYRRLARLTASNSATASGSGMGATCHRGAAEDSRRPPTGGHPGLESSRRTRPRRSARRA